MQVISLVSRDGFLSKYNVSVTTDDFIEKLKDFPNFFTVDFTSEPFVSLNGGNWSDRYTAK